MNSSLSKRISDNSAWCRRRTNMERYLILLLLVTFLVAATLCITLSIIILKKSSASNDICLTSGCIHAASTALKYIDQSVNPCDDFYQFACGTYLKNTIIPEDKSVTASFTSMSDTIREQLKAIIEEPLPPDAGKPYQLMKKVYSMCMNTSAIETDSLPFVLRSMKEVGGWPLLEGDKWDEDEFDWKELVYKLRKKSRSGSLFVSVYISDDDKNSTRRIIHIGEGRLGLSREFLIKGFDEKIVKAYYDYMVDIAVLYGADKETALKELKETLLLEMKIANITLPKEERRNSSRFYNPMKVEELLDKYPFMPWVEYINNVLIIPNVTIFEDEEVIVTVPEYIPKIEKILKETPRRIQANYIMRLHALSAIWFLPDEFRNRQLEYIKVLTGQSERTARWKECTSVATGSFHLAAGSAYVKKYFNRDSKKHAQELVDDIKTEFVKLLRKVDWMDQVTRKHALEKAASMVSYIGYPDELLDEKKIENYYADLDITSDEFIKVMQSISIFFSELYLKKFREPINKTEWTEHAYPTIVNAFYSSSENSISFPAGILQGIFFDNERPRYLNYGGIGYVIGHEITHGFDDQGRQFDKDGNLHDWWQEETKQAFIKKAKCLIEQYGNETEVDINLNGINTQGENIADNGGIKEAYLAYKEWVFRNSPELRLPGLKYTPNQLFWISAAQTWCSKHRDEIMKLMVTLGYHSPSKYRVLIPFGNSEFFAKDYDCPSGSKMNPVHKCSVW